MVSASAHEYGTIFVTYCGELKRYIGNIYFKLCDTVLYLYYVINIIVKDYAVYKLFFTLDSIYFISC